jgi:hypothetical protein
LREGANVAPQVPLRVLLEALESREYPEAAPGEAPAAHKVRLQAYEAEVARQEREVGALLANQLSLVVRPGAGGYLWEFYDARYTDPYDFAPGAQLWRSRDPRSALLGVDAIVHALRGLRGGVSFEDVVAALKVLGRLRDAGNGPLVTVTLAQVHPLKGHGGAVGAVSTYGARRAGGKWTVGGLRGQSWSFKYREPGTVDRDPGVDPKRRR